jgi:hypothetical protein
MVAGRNSGLHPGCCVRPGLVIQSCMSGRESVALKGGENRDIGCRYIGRRDGTTAGPERCERVSRLHRAYHTGGMRGTRGRDRLEAARNGCLLDYP